MKQDMREIYKIVGLWFVIVIVPVIAAIYIDNILIDDNRDRMTENTITPEENVITSELTMPVSNDDETDKINAYPLDNDIVDVIVEKLGEEHRYFVQSVIADGTERMRIHITYTTLFPRLFTVEGMGETLSGERYQFQFTMAKDTYEQWYIVDMFRWEPVSQ